MNWKAPFRHLWMSLAGLVLIIQVWVVGTASAIATGVYNIPALAADDPTWVIDQADILSRITESEISKELEDLANTTGNEVRIVTIHRFDYGETAESFTEKLFDKWFSTSDIQANQVLLVLDSVTNATAIRAGDAVKKILSNETTQSIAQETVMTPLRSGNKYNQAFLDASDRLVAILSGQPDPGPPIVEEDIRTEGTFAKAEETDDKSATIVVVVLLVAATVIPMATYFLYQVFQS